MRNVNVSEWIDQRKLSGYQILIIILCGFGALLDGFDTLTISFVAPEIAKEWHANIATFGPVFSAGLFGLMFGTLFLGPLADRIGRKSVIVLSSLLFGVCSLLTTFAGSVNELMFYRFITGIGLGGSMANVIALTAEYSPKRLRTTMVSVMFIGMPMGSLVGGLLCAKLMSTYGWQSIFIVGGIVPILLAAVLFFVLPESIRFLVAKGTQSSKVHSILNRMDASAKFDSTYSFYLPEAKVEGFTVKHLFGPGRTRNTILLWFVFFMNLMSTYFLQNWMPSVFKSAGFTTERAVLTATMMQFGGILGGIVVSRLGDKTSPRKVLTWFYPLAAIAVASIGFIGSPYLLMAIVCLSGFTVTGSQFVINALAASVYPTGVRSTGVGWALGIGRIGSVIGPIIGGILISLKWSPSSLFLVGAIPSALNAIAVLFMVSQKNHEVAVDSSEPVDVTVH